MAAPVDGALNGRTLERAEDEAAAKVHELLIAHVHVFLIRPGDGENVTLELHTKRGRQQVYHVSIEQALSIIDDVAGTGAFGVVVHVASPPLIVQKLALVNALASAVPAGSA